MKKRHREQLATGAFSQTVRDIAALWGASGRVYENDADRVRLSLRGLSEAHAQMMKREFWGSIEFEAYHSAWRWTTEGRVADDFLRVVRACLTGDR